MTTGQSAAEGLLLDRITKRFGTHTVIDAATFSATEGEFIVMVGPSGCGKSTLLRLIAGLERASDGRILIGGRDVTHLDPAQRDLAMVFQSYALYPHLDVARNMGFSLSVARRPRAEIAARVAEVAAMLRLTELLHRKPSDLSGGQRQRVAIGRALVRNPRVFLFDEPLSNLDAELRVALRRDLAVLHRQIGATMVYVTHDQIEAMTLADRIVVLDQGRIQQIGRSDDLYRRPANRFVAGFIGSPKMNFVPMQVAEASGTGQLTLSRSADPGSRLRLRVADRSLPVGATVTLGIRPEHLSAAAAPDGAPGLTLRATSTMVESMGNVVYEYFTTSDDLPLTVERRDLVAAGQGAMVDLFAPDTALHLFGPNGDRIETV